MRTDLDPLYDWFENRPDQHSQDFNEVMAWLASHGAGSPSISLLPATYTGPLTRAIPPVMLLTFPKYPSNPMDASLVLNSPGVVLQLLDIKVPDYNYAPPVPPAPPATPPASGGSEVAAYSYTDERGKRHYFVNPEYPPAPGKKVTGPQGETLQQYSRQGPFGFWQEWMEV